MTLLTDKPKEVWAVEVPEGATNFGWRAGQFTCQLPDSPPNTFHWLTAADDMMKRKGGEWRYICTSKGITNEQAEQMVERDGDGFKDYSKDNFHPDIPFEWAPNSLDSLLASKGLDVNINYCLIEKM